MTETAGSYQDGIYQAWVGELQGEMFFERKAQAAAEESRGEERSEECRKWKELAELERVTGRRMAALLESKQVELAAPEMSGQLLAFVDTFAQMPHAEAIAALRPILVAAIERFEALLAQAPDADRQAVQFLVDHEKALLTFVELEEAGHTDASLDATRTLTHAAKGH